MHQLNELSHHGNGRAVLNRYSYQGKLEDQPILSFCDKNGIDIQFIEVLWEAFQMDCLPEKEQLVRFETTMILDYLEKTHAYYREKLLPELELTLFQMLQTIGTNNPISIEMLLRFDAYRRDLVEHIEDEENQFFSYTRQLLRTEEKTLKYSVNQFVNEHKHKEDQIDGMVEFLKRNVENCDLLTYKVFIAKLELLQRDLAIHAYVEDYVLVPKVRLLED